MWDLAVREEDFQSIDAMLARYRARPPLSMRLLPAAARSETETMRALLEEGRTTESRQLQIAARYAASYLQDFSLADSLARLDVKWRERPVNRAGAQLLLGGLAAAEGRWSAAADAFRTAETMEGAGPVIIHRAIAATVPLQPVSPDELRAIRAELERWVPPPAVGAALAGALQAHNRLYLIGLLSSRAGDWAAAEQAASVIEMLPAPAAGRNVARSLAATVRADVAWMQNRPEDALRALDEADDRIPLELIALSRATHVREFGLEHARHLRGVVLAALGRDAEALTWLRFGLRGSPQEYLYTGPVHVQLGRIFERLNQPDSSAVRYRKFLDLWSRADSAAAPQLEDVRRRLSQAGRRHP